MPLTESWYARDARAWTCGEPDAGAAVFHRRRHGHRREPPLRAALTGTGAPSLRRDLGLDADANPPEVVCLCTEGPLSA
jgi:hypothetical protein